MSSVSPELLEILVCPETKQPVAPAGADLLARLNEQIRAGRVRTRGGRALSDPIAEALVRQDGRVLYAVDDGIPVMLIEESIALEDVAADRSPLAVLVIGRTRGA